MSSSLTLLQHNFRALIGNDSRHDVQGRRYDSIGLHLHIVTVDQVSEERLQHC